MCGFEGSSDELFTNINHAQNLKLLNVLTPNTVPSLIFKALLCESPFRTLFFIFRPILKNFVFRRENKQVPAKVPQRALFERLH